MFAFIKANKFEPFWRLLFVVMMLTTFVSISACSNKEKTAGQALARVNGEEITIHQVNDELSRTDVQAGQQEVSTKQLLESLIDSQLIIDEAKRNKIHRTPEVMQAIERAKARIIEQAYLEYVISKIAKPSMAEINDYFQKHPEYFADRKQFEMQQLVLSTKDISEELRLVFTSAKSIDEIATWLDKHNVRYERGQLSRNTTNLPEQMAEKLQKMNKGQLFIVKEGERNLLNSIQEIKDSPVTLKKSIPLIEQYLLNKKSRETMNAEILHLRSLAKIEYLTVPNPPVH